MAMYIRNNQGFTLIELLIVLAVVSVLLLLTLPKMFDTVVKQQTNHFFETFNSDILYLQNKSLNNTDRLRIFLRRDQYYLLNNNVEMMDRPYHHSIRLLDYQAPQIVFNRNGNIQQPYTYTFKGNQESYRVIFPFGKGRHYVQEQ